MISIHSFFFFALLTFTGTKKKKRFQPVKLSINTRNMVGVNNRDISLSVLEIIYILQRYFQAIWRILP